jgi:hypothetical protein
MLLFQNGSTHRWIAGLGRRPAARRRVVRSGGSRRRRRQLRFLRPPQLQIPPQGHRRHYVRATVRVHQYPDGSLAIFDGPRCLARFDPKGEPTRAISQAA